MRQYVRSGLIASIVVGLAASAGAQAPPSTKAGNPAGPATKAAMPPRPAILDQVLGTVNGKSITREDLIRFFNAVGIPQNETDEQRIYEIGMENLVNHELVKQYLQKQKALEIPEKDLNAEYADTEKKFKDQGQDMNVYLASQGMTVARAKEDMKDMLRWKKYIEAVSSDLNLKKFVADNKDHFNKTQVKASHIVLNVPPDTAPADKEKIKQKLVAIKRDIDSGKITFADAANRYSEDDRNKTSPNGGDQGYFPRRGVIEEFAAAAFALPKGKVSDPVDTPFGYHLILVTDRKEGPPIDFEAKKPDIRSEYAADLSERIVKAELKTAKIKVEPMPADLFPKAPPQQPTTPPAQTPAKAATPPGGGAVPK
jgi:peptidyl-prolyl cis-trans isomerase C